MYSERRLEKKTKKEELKQRGKIILMKGET
jgi:hypothetical protein